MTLQCVSSWPFLKSSIGSKAIHQGGPLFRGQANRYPIDTRGKLISLAHEEVDLHRLADVMNGLEGYFSGCDGYLDSLQSAAL
jgi:hypothetical protein